MIKIIHTADTHLRDSQYGRRSRSDDFLQSFLAVLHTAKHHGVDTILVSGDLLDSTRPSPKIIAALKKVDALARFHGIAILVTSGNHDLTDPHWATVAGVGEPTINGVVAPGLQIIDNQLVTLRNGLTVYGQPFVSREKLAQIKDTLPAADVLMFHATVEELIDFPSKSAIPLAELPTDRYQCIALGDIHITKYTVVPGGPQGAGCLVGYPGSTELCESSEADQKTVSELMFAPSATPRVLLRPIPTRPVLRYKLNTEDELNAALLDAEAKKETDPIIVVEYNVGLGQVLSRFAARVDPTKVLLRMYPMFRDPKQANLGKDERAALTLHDFLDKFIAPGTPLHGLAKHLLDVGYQPAVIHEQLDRYIETRRQEILAVDAVQPTAPALN